MTYEQGKYRLQLLAELGVGALTRKAVNQEDAAITALREATSGNR